MSTELAREIADGLRSLAQMIEDNPELAPSLDCHTLNTINIPAGYGEDTSMVEELAAFARAGKASGASVRKEYDSTYGGVKVGFGTYVGLHVYADRAEVCERVVTGTEVVKKTVPDPSVVVPTVEVEETIETVEWRCAPLLAEAGGR